MILIDPNELKMNVCSFVHNNEEMPCLNQLTSCLWNKVRVCDFNRIINNTSTIEAEPIRHGYWKDVEFTLFRVRFATCSECGVRQLIDKDNFCPNCGAKMGMMLE